jgi:hypothetical protein
LFLGREPADAAEVAFHRQHPNLESLRRGFAGTAEFKDFFYSDIESGDAHYRVPLFLLRPPSDSAIPTRFELPTLERPTSQLCTYNQMCEPVYRTRCAELTTPSLVHRKYWEWCYVLQVMHVAGVIAPGKRALGFGTGREPLPSLLASRGMTVVASDAPIDLDDMQGWKTTGQHSQSALDLHLPDLISQSDFLQRVSFRPVDMSAIPPDLIDFDVCWSSCSFEHLGSIKQGLRFVEDSLKCLRPGGMAVHTTELNLDSNDATVETSSVSLFRKRDIEELCGRLVAAGHDIWPLNMHPGLAEVDEFIDLPPFAVPHLKLQLAGVTTTSIGITVRKSLQV